MNEKMSTTTQIVLAACILTIIGLVMLNASNNKKEQNNPSAPVVANAYITGCYMAKLSQDVYSLDIAEQDGEIVRGTLVFDNFEKDSSYGEFSGTYQDGILLGDYVFQSEGTESVMQVIFKRDTAGFVRGFGPMDSTTATRFDGLQNVTYDNSQVFKLTDDVCPKSI